MYVKTTRQVKIRVEPMYLDDRSSPADDEYVWAYTVLIENLGVDTIRLLTRYWHITDAFGRVQEVRGDGVIGEQPVLKAGESFSYTSGVPLMTPSGIMVGHYTFEVQPDGNRFDAEIPAFSLDCPYQVVRQH